MLLLCTLTSYLGAYAYHNTATTKELNAATTQQLNAALDVERGLLPSEPTSEEFPDDEQREYERQRRVMKYRYDMLRQIEDLDPNAEKAKRFSLCPIKKLGRGFITVDNRWFKEGLYGIVKYNAFDLPREALQRLTVEVERLKRI